MFERYTEKARRTIFFARYEAAAAGSTWIEDRHLLLGLMREAHVADHATTEAIRAAIQAKRTQPVGESGLAVDLPLSQTCKLILSEAAEEAQGLKHRHIGTEHLYLAVLKVGDQFLRDTLAAHGITRETILAKAVEAAAVSPGPPPPPPPPPLDLSTFGPSEPSPEALLLRQLVALVRKLPAERGPAALQVLSALRWDSVTFSVSGSGGSFAVKLDQEREKE